MTKFKIGDEVFIRAAECNCSAVNTSINMFDQYPACYTIIAVQSTVYKEYTTVKYILAPEFGEHVIADASELAYYEDYLRILDVARRSAKKESKTNETKN